VTKELKEIINKKKRVFFTGSEIEKKRSIEKSSVLSKLPN